MNLLNLLGGLYFQASVFRKFEKDKKFKWGVKYTMLTVFTLTIIVSLEAILLL